jgi:hypothetical protein
MFIRENKKRSVGVSIQIVSKHRGRYKVVKTVGCATDVRKIAELKKEKPKNRYMSYRVIPVLFFIGKRRFGRSCNPIFK